MSGILGKILSSWEEVQGSMSTRKLEEQVGQNIQRTSKAGLAPYVEGQRGGQGQLNKQEPHISPPLPTQVWVALRGARCTCVPSSLPSPPLSPQLLPVQALLTCPKPLSGGDRGVYSLTHRHKGRVSVAQV